MNKKLYPEPWRRGKFYYFTISEAGRRRNVSTGETGKEKARQVVREYIEKHRRGTDLTFRDYAAQYFKWETCPRVARLLDEGKSISLEHVKHCRMWLDRYVITDHIFSGIQMKEITRGDILNLRQRLRSNALKKKSSTLNKVIKTVKAVFSEAHYREDIPANPGSQIGEINYTEKERGVFEVDEVRNILHYRPGKMKTNPLVDVAFATLFFTGVRAGELRALRWGSIDMDTGRTRIKEAFKSEKELGLPKWNKIRDIVLPRLLLVRLKEWREQTLYKKPEQFVFSTLDGDPIGRNWLKTGMQKLLKEAESDRRFNFKIDGRWLTPHSCRHACNTVLLAAGVSPLLVQSYLGWTSVEINVLTKIQKNYTKLQLLRLEDVADALDEIYGEDPQASAASGH